MKKIQLIAVFLSCFAFAAPATGDIFFFGDSLTDSGNLFNLIGVPAAPYFDGRFSNGPTWAEGFAAQSGAAAVASSNGGTNYAYGAARSGPSSFPFINLVDQVNSYVAGGAPGDSEDLFVVWAGSNDIFDAADSGDPAAAVASTVLNISSSIQTLQANGAERFMVLNSTPLGQTPFYQPLGAPTIDFLNILSASFNDGLAAQVPTLESSLGIDIIEVDIFSLFVDVQADPASYGLLNVTDSATPFDQVSGLSSGLPTVDPEDFLFWDGIHPTAAGHRIIADYAFSVSAVPEPSGVMLLATLGFVFCVRRKRH